MTTGIVLILIVIAASIIYLRRYAPEEEQPVRPAEEVLTELIFRELAAGNDRGAVALFCAYRALTAPDGGKLAADLAAAVDRRYGMRLPWPEDLQFSAALLLDDYYDDRLTELEFGIEEVKENREHRKKAMKLPPAVVAKSGW